MGQDVCHQFGREAGCKAKPAVNWIVKIALERDRFDISFPETRFSDE